MLGPGTTRAPQEHTNMAKADVSTKKVDKRIDKGDLWKGDLWHKYEGWQATSIVAAHYDFSDGGLSQKRWLTRIADKLTSDWSRRRHWRRPRKWYTPLYPLSLFTLCTLPFPKHNSECACSAKHILESDLSSSSKISILVSRRNKNNTPQKYTSHFKDFRKRDRSAIEAIATMMHPSRQAYVEEEAEVRFVQPTCLFKHR